MTAPDPPTAPRELVAANEAVVAAWRARDVEALAASFEQEAVMSIPDRPPIVGRGRIRAAIEEAFATAGVSIDCEPRAIRGGDRMGYAWVDYVTTVTDNAGSRSHPGAYLAVWTLDRDRWRISAYSAHPTGPMDG